MLKDAINCVGYCLLVISGQQRGYAHAIHISSNLRSAVPVNRLRIARSRRVISASYCHSTRCNSPGLNPSILPQSRI